VTHTLWAANPHEYGPGKVHMVDPENREKTYCGRFTAAIPGKPVQTGKATCQICLQGPLRRAEQKKNEERWARDREEWEKRRAAENAQRERERAEYRARYHAYLETPQWREKSQLVISRAGGVCQGCGKARATQAHHLTYEHIGNELLWELVAVCRPCHERAHGLDDNA
jgi:5-methylcytosine-specific restriction endonuclease McrA